MISKCRKVHIGVFFDGTGNNKVNDTPQGCESNIAKLSELYINGKISNWCDEYCEHYGHMIYVNGVGTADNERRLLIDKTEKGAGGGGAKRINETINKLVKLLDKTKGLYKDYNEKDGSGYQERYINVFGFSRGAAMARDFINTFNDKNYRYFHLKNITFNFVGLYDTVGSFGSAGDDTNFKPKETNTNSTLDTLAAINPGAKLAKYVNDNFLNNEARGLSSEFDIKYLTAYSRQEAQMMEKNLLDSTKPDENKWSLVETKMGPLGEPPYTMKFRRIKEGFEEYNFNLSSYSAKTIIHMVASDEVRQNFPLSSLSGIGQEWVYAGVHSDVGGGYMPSLVEPHSKEVGTFANYSQAKLAKDKFIKEHGSSWQVTVVPTRIPISLTTKITDMPHKVKASKNRTVTNELSFVSLHRMYEQAVASNVPFKKMSYKMPNSMNSYDAHTKASPDSAMDFKGIAFLKENYYHHSAVDQNDLDTFYDGNTSAKAILFDDSPDNKLFGGNDTRYVNNKPKRAIFNNVHTKAIKPFA